MIGVKADNSGVMAATGVTLKRLGQLTGFSQRQVLLGFAGVVLKTCAGRTKVSTQARVDRSSHLHAVKSLGYSGSKKEGRGMGDVTVNAGFRKDKLPFGHVWIRARNRGNKTDWLMARGANFSAPQGKGAFSHYRRSLKSLKGSTGNWFANVDKAATEVATKLPISIAKGRRSIGMARQSWVQIADALGIDLLKVQGGGTLSAEGIAKAKAALASSGKAFRNGYGLQGGSGGYDFVDLINRYPGGRKLGFDRTLLGVLAGQNKFFQQSYAKGAFDSQAKACRAYPNLFRFRSDPTTTVWRQAA